MRHVIVVVLVVILVAVVVGSRTADACATVGASRCQMHTILV